MPTEMITPGTTFTMTQNQIYAIPPQRVYRLTFNDGNTYQSSNDPVFGTFFVSPNGTDLGRAFLRCTTGNGIIRLLASG